MELLYNPTSQDLAMIYFNDAPMLKRQNIDMIAHAAQKRKSKFTVLVQKSETLSTNVM